MLNKFVMIKSTKKEKERYKTAALLDGFHFVSTWFRWVAINRIRLQAVEARGDKYEKKQDGLSKEVQSDRMRKADDEYERGV